ncbi:glycosyltransferase [Vibrio owensii]|uniref:glycosyltransferase n=1 Tax=Vibrio owensii TaxID=696485 RepID=UPI0039099D33
MSSVMFNIVIFNKNYSRYLEELFDSLSNNKVFNDNSVKIYFCDDASSDDSLLFVNDYKSRYSISNLSIIQTRKTPFVRKHFSHGQIEGLKLVFENSCEYEQSYFFLLDSDDLYSSTYVSSVRKEIERNSPNLLLCNTQDFNTETTFEQKKIKRKISARPGIWPTVVLTSAIVISYDFIRNNREAIFDFSYSDVWLDSRLNILGLNDYKKVVYLNPVMFRRIHSSNDSKKMNLKRKIIKQIEATEYFNKYVNVETRFNLRRYFLEKLSQCIRK